MGNAITESRGSCNILENVRSGRNCRAFLDIQGKFLGLVGRNSPNLADVGAISMPRSTARPLESKIDFRLEVQSRSIVAIINSDHTVGSYKTCQTVSST